jgi:hypothetical protein
LKRIELVGVDGSNPLGFLASLGLLCVVPGAKLQFSEDGSFRAFVEGLNLSKPDLVRLVAADAETAASARAGWRFTYTKAATKKKGEQKVADLKAPPNDFKKFIATALEAWLTGDDEAVGYAAAYGTDIAVDNNGNTKPTAFHFTAANQTFLGAVDGIRASLTKEWVETSLFNGHGERHGSNLRWDPGAERNWALMANDPNDDGTLVDAPLEWLAFRGLPLLPSFPRGSRIITTAVFGRGDEMTFRWPLWSIPASLATIRSAIQIDWTQRASERVARGIFAICSSTIRRTKQGNFGNFGPSSVVS